MNDDLESAEAGLANGASSFHKVRMSASSAAWYKADVDSKRRAWADDDLWAHRWGREWLPS